MNGPALFEETQSFSPWLYAVAAIVLAILAGVLMLRQSTAVTPDAVSVRFGFLYRTRIPIAELKQAEAVEYRPIAEYGGWGIRQGRDGVRVLNARGNRGVRIDLADGTRLLIGSQRPEDLARALERALRPIS